MKCNDFIRLIKKQGWVFLRQGKGSHEIYTKDGNQEVVPNHGSKEMGKALKRSCEKEWG